MTRWLITGAAGMVGTDLQYALSVAEEDFTALSHLDLDLTDEVGVRRAVATHRPTVIVNCAAWTRVDDAELREDEAARINGTAVGYLAAACNRTGTLLTQISTDFVFDGAGRAPYEIDAAVAPLSAYGRTKLIGETAAGTAHAHAIVRTSWLFGNSGPSFVEAIRRQIRAGKRELRVVNDQRGRPTWTPHLAEALITISRAAERDAAARGIYHYADEPACTWFELAEEIVAVMRETGELTEDVVVDPVSSSEFPRPAVRPAYSVLSTDRYERELGGKPGSWKEGLREFLKRDAV